MAIEVKWEGLRIPDTDFDIAALHIAIDAQRIERGLSWKAVALEINRSGERVGPHPISPSTISGLKNKRWGVEGDGVLQMLLWLDRTPEVSCPIIPAQIIPMQSFHGSPATGSCVLTFLLFMKSSTSTVRIVD
jgi:hypothetical protein